MLVYILNEWRVPVPVLQSVAGRAKPRNGERIVGEIVQELIDQGRAEGIAEGMANLLMTYLKHRFGQLPEPLRRQIADASPVQLDACYAAALSGKSLSEVRSSLTAD